MMDSPPTSSSNAASLNHQLKLLLKHGYLTQEELNSCQQACEARGMKPLRWLEERGGLSGDVLAAIRQLLLDAQARSDSHQASPLPPPVTAELPTRTVPEMHSSQAVTKSFSDEPAPAGTNTPLQPHAQQHLSAWRHYKLLRLLGQGGMGQVYLASDPRLLRNVAIKLVKRDSQQANRRLVSEARAQARIQHAHVCPVYEVGEVGGQVYIAMRHIEGQSLGTLAPQLGLEAITMLVRDAAMGVHAAHQVGIIHRDLKPSNIMVERQEDGRLIPYVMDFGLAAAPDTDGLNQTGEVMGTPSYMSPEQAKGEFSRLDRRADVYSLGATLYHLLVGRPPILGENALDILSRIEREEPVLPRSVVPDLPPDLEAITLKCLEKDRSQRYDSALALAQELDRFLSGEPIQARHANRRDRLQKWLQKNKRLAWSALIFGLILISTACWTLYIQSAAKERERLAREFTEQVEHIESSARYSALSPLHKLDSDRASLQRQMTELSHRIQLYGNRAAAPGQYALGRGYMALGEPQRARVHLELAWQNGFQEPRAAYALALVMAQEYQTKLQAAERLELRRLIQARKEALAKQYRAPLLEYLERSRGAPVPSKAYVEALVAFAEERFDDALKHLELIEQLLPWFYEAPALRAEVLRARALKRRLTGDRAGASDDRVAGRAAYLAAIKMGESVPELFYALGQLEYSEMAQALYGDGNVVAPFERGIEALSKALLLQPTYYDAWVMDALFHRRLWEYKSNRGEAKEELLKRSLSSAEQAIQLAPTRSEAFMELASNFWQQAEELNGRGQDPTTLLKRSQEALARVPPEAQDYDYHRQTGLVHQTWAEYLIQSGSNPDPQFREAAAAFQAAMRQDDQIADAWINLGTLYYSWAKWPQAAELDLTLERAKSTLEVARQRDPGNVAVYFYEAQTLEAMAGRQLRLGSSPRQLLQEALVVHHEGIRINPELPQLYNGAGSVLVALAQDAWETGGDPLPFLDEAERSFRQAIRVAPQQGFAYFNIGEVGNRQVRYRLAMGQLPTSELATALLATEQSVSRMSELAPPWSSLAFSWLLSAELRLLRKQSPLRDLRAAEAALERALKLNAVSLYGLLGRAERLALLHRYGHQLGTAGDSGFVAAESAYRAVLSIDPAHDETLLRLGWLYWHDAQALGERDQKQQKLVHGQWQRRVEAGLKTVALILQRRPSLPEAQLLQGLLLLSQADKETEIAAQRAKATEALAQLESAAKLQPRLRARWQSFETRARRVGETGP